MSADRDMFEGLSEEQEAAIASPLCWPEHADAPAGWRYGAHISLGPGRGNGWWLLHEGGGAVTVVETRPDVDLEDCTDTVEALDAIMAGYESAGGASR